MTDDYQDLSDFIQSRGFFTRLRDHYGLICASKKSSNGDLGGTSFWVTVRNGEWYIASWGYRYWHISDPDTVCDVCLAWLLGGQGLDRPPDRVLEQFQLEECSLQVFRQILAPGDE